MQRYPTNLTPPNHPLYPQIEEIYTTHKKAPESCPNPHIQPSSSNRSSGRFLGYLAHTQDRDLTTNRDSFQFMTASPLSRTFSDNNNPPVQHIFLPTQVERHQLRANNVQFAYNNEKRIICQISLFIPTKAEIGRNINHFHTLSKP